MTPDPVGAFAALFTADPGLPTLPGLTVVARVGGGGFGDVYEAVDPVHGRVAVKVLRPGGDRDRFRREFHAVRRLRHPGVVVVHDLAGDDDPAWFTMEFLPGGSLAEAFASPPPVGVVVGYARSLAETLAYAHDRRVCHLDLKPSNVVLDAAGRPVVVDFGLAAALDESRPALADEGRGYTADYAAPEVRAGEPDLRPVRADVYSFGAVLRRGLAGARGVPADLRAIYEKCLEPDPAARYAGMADVLADLDALRDGRPVSARPRRWPVRAGRVVRRHPFWTAFVLLFVGVVAVAGWQAWVRNEERKDRDQVDRTRAAADEARRVAGLVADADAAFRTGRWDRAAEGYAGLTDHADADHFRLRRLRALFAGGRVAEFQAELPDAPTPQVLLLRAELAFLDPLKAAAGRDLIRQALPGLAGADEAYARGLLADAAPDMLTRFEDATTRDATHYPSQAALATGLLVTGRYADARVRAGLVRGLFPDDLLPDFVEGTADLMDDDGPGGTARLDRLADRLGGARGERLRAHARGVAAQLAAVRKWTAASGMGATLAPGGGATADRGGVAKLYSPDGFPLGVPSPVVSRLFEPGVAYMQAARLFFTGNAAKAAEVAEAAMARDPDAALATFACGLRFVRSQKLVGSPSPDDRRQLEANLRRAVELGDVAAACPSRYPGGSFRYEARAYAAVAMACLAREADFPAAAAEFRPRLLAAVPRLVADGARFSAMRRDVVTALVSTEVLASADARALLAIWIAAASEPAAWELLVRVELRAANPVAAKDAADRGRAAHPADAAFHRRLDRLFTAPPIPAPAP